MGRLNVKGKQVNWSSLIIYIIVAIIAIIFMIPFLWMLSSSFKYQTDVINFPNEWIPKNPILDNYKNMWIMMPFIRYFGNTIKLTVTITFIQLITSSMAAYSFAKLKYPGRDKLFLVYLATLMIPFQTIMIPQFIEIRILGITDPHLALILISSFTAFGTFLVRQFFLGIPESLSEAARMDGYNEFFIFTRIMLPLGKPALVSLGVFTFVYTWNDFLPPLIYINSNAGMTIQLGINSMFTQYNIDYALVMAATACSLIPLSVAYFSAQRYFVQGIATSGIKG